MEVRDFGVALPLATRGVLSLGFALASPVGIAALFALAAAVWLIAAIVWGIRAAAGRAILVLCVVWALASILLLVVAILLPLTAMIESLERGAGP